MEAESSTNDNDVTQQAEGDTSSHGPSLSAIGKNYLVPVRVDVSSDDKSIRIVETLLMDPTVWPIPLTPPLHESVNRNVREVAHTLLSDLEVQGMGRTVRHFTGRVDLWSLSLQQKIEDQLRPQLWNIATGNNLVGCQQTSHNDGKKNGSAVPIKIRISVHGVMIKEDIMWDPSVPDYSPLDFAQTLGEELNLPEEAVIAVATTIVEQLHGITMEDSEETSSSPSKSGIGATYIDQKDHLSNISHIVNLHRPT